MFHSNFAGIERKRDEERKKKIINNVNERIECKKRRKIEITFFMLNELV